MGAFNLILNKYSLPNVTISHLQQIINNIHCSVLCKQIGGVALSKILCQQLHFIHIIPQLIPAKL